MVPIALTTPLGMAAAKTVAVAVALGDVVSAFFAALASGIGWFFSGLASLLTKAAAILFRVGPPLVLVGGAAAVNPALAGPTAAVVVASGAV